jgi:hypothetical protein
MKQLMLQRIASSLLLPSFGNRQQPAQQQGELPSRFGQAQGKDKMLAAKGGCEEQDHELEGGEA